MSKIKKPPVLLEKDCLLPTCGKPFTTFKPGQDCCCSKCRSKLRHYRNNNPDFAKKHPKRIILKRKPKHPPPLGSVERLVETFIDSKPGGIKDRDPRRDETDDKHQVKSRPARSESWEKPIEKNTSGDKARQSAHSEPGKQDAPIPQKKPLKLSLTIYILLAVLLVLVVFFLMRNGGNGKENKVS
jgi:hypothetical protein